MRWRGTLWVVPIVATVVVLARRFSRLETGPDAGVFTGMVRNLRSSFSLTSPTDQYWMRLSPAATVERLGHLPVPDFGPLYSALVAVVPAPLDVAFVLVHGAALLVAVSAVGYLALRATESVPMAVAAQLIALWGPLAPELFFPHGAPLDLYASFGSDGLAVALALAGLAVVVAGRAPTAGWRWFGIGAATLLAAAILTRYAMAGAVAGILIGLLIAWVRARDRRWPWAAVAVAVALVWQLLVYPLLVDDAGPKSLVFHRGDIAPLGTTIAGWFGLTVTGTLAAAIFIAVGIGLLVVGVLARPGGVVALSALAAVGQLAIVVVARNYLDAGLNLREERHVLLVRFVAAILIVAGLTNVIRWAMVRRQTDDIGTALTLGAIATAVVAAVAAGGWPIPEPLRPAQPMLAVRTWIDEHGRLPVISDQSDTWYTQTGVPAADVPRIGEPSTNRPRDVAAEMSALAAVAPHIVQAYRPGFPDGVDLRTLPCAVVGDTWSGPELDGFELAVVDISGCA